jgi:hypothetical protein
VSHSIAVLLSVFALCLSGCSRTIINHPINRVGDGWTLVIREVTDGPNSVDEGNIILEPKDGERFIWVILTLRNDEPRPRTFNFDRCDLDMGTKTVVPSTVTHDMLIGYASEMNRAPELEPEESIDRRLVFVYPQAQSPTRLRCEPMEIPLPQF